MPTAPNPTHEAAIVATANAVDYQIAKLRRYLAHPEANELYGDHIIATTAQVVIEAETLAAMVRRLIETGYPF